MKILCFKLILFLIFTSPYLWASSIHEQLQLNSSLILEKTCSKGLACSTLMPETTHHKHNITEENDTLEYLPPSISFSSDYIYGQVITKFKISKKRSSGLHSFGVLISPYHVLTNAENLFKHNLGYHNYISSIEVPESKKWAYEAIFAPYSDIKKLGTKKVLGHTLIAPRPWIENDTRPYEHNYGLIILEEPIGETLGWAGLKTLKDDSKDKNITATFVNYRDTIDHPPCLIPLLGQIRGVDPHQIFYSMDSSKPLVCAVVLAQETKNIGYSVLGFGKNSIDDVDNEKALRITPEIFRHLIAWQQGNYLSVDQDIKFKTYKKRANKPYNDPQAQLNLAEHYKYIKKNEEKAFDWYLDCSLNKIKDEKQASKSHENIGNYYREVSKDIDLAIAYYKISKSASSFYKIGEIYQGKGDLEQAERWFQRVINITNEEQ